MASEATLREQFESEGYDVGEVSVNRDQVRVTVLDDEADHHELREITHRVVGAENVLGFDVTRESSDAHEGFSTVVSFRDRS